MCQIEYLMKLVRSLLLTAVLLTKEMRLFNCTNSLGKLQKKNPLICCQELQTIVNHLYVTIMFGHLEHCARTFLQYF